MLLVAIYRGNRKLDRLIETIAFASCERHRKGFPQYFPLVQNSKNTRRVQCSTALAYFVQFVAVSLSIKTGNPTRYQCRSSKRNVFRVSSDSVTVNNLFSNQYFFLYSFSRSQKIFEHSASSAHNVEVRSGPVSPCAGPDRTKNSKKDLWSGRESNTASTTPRRENIHNYNKQSIHSIIE